ncbi:MAG: hypothetical protein ACON4C_03795 [Henriciella sp.]|jgi:hypothetical protein
MALRSLLFSLIAMLPSSAGYTQTADPVDVLGSWTFQTQPYRDGQCLMTGTMRLTSHPDRGLYGCELTAVELCSMWGRSVVVQTCQARRFGKQLTVRSSINQIVEQEMEGLVYVPDNFTLTIQDAAMMYGALISAATAPAIFRRAIEGIS